MDFFVWQGRRRERRREFWQHAASLCRGAHLQAHTHPARGGQHAARLRSGTGLASRCALQAGEESSPAIDDDPNVASGKRRGFMARYGLGLV